jgi:hypothetical protein
MGKKEESSNIVESSVEIYKSNPRNESYSLAKALIQERTLQGNRMGINDDLTNTNLISKNFSPMIIRKYNLSALNGWPMWVGLIIDEDLTNLDFIINGAIKACEDSGMIGNNIQMSRNITGIISETIKNYYNSIKENCVEGIAITLYLDKVYVQNYTGDFMNFMGCRLEYGLALSMLPHI